MSKFTLPSVFSYSRSIQTSIGYFYSVGKNNNLSPIKIVEENLRASFSDYTAALKKSPEQLAQGNIHKIESSYLPHDSDTMLLKFNVKIVSNMLSPSNTNEEQAALDFEKFVNLYVGAGGAKLLAEKYIKSLISCGFLWRNKTVSESISLTVTHDDKEYVFEVPKNINDDYYKKYSKEIKSLSLAFEKGLTDESYNALFDVNACCKMGMGQEVFPSQEFMDDKGDLDRVLSSVSIDGVKQATYHKDKISNAIRTIDDWYPEANGRPLAVEPYGLDQAYSVARRTGANSLYGIIEKNLFSFIETLESKGKVTDDMHFIVACLVRGGVYSGKSKK